MDLMTTLKERIANSLRRKSITTCSAWAEKYRVMGKPYPGPWSFLHHPWTRAMHDDKREFIVGQKAAQLGFTEVALNKTFYSIDILGESILYILPSTTPDANVFSTSRFDPALELSEHLANLFSDVKNIGHKRAGSASLFVRGSRSRSQLKSLPVGKIVLDEFDEMNKENVVLALERTSGQIDKQVFAISTPTIENYGINAYFKLSTQEHFFFPCPHCSRHIELTFPDCMVITSDDWTSREIERTHIICPLCKHELAHQDKPIFLAPGHWVPTYTDRTVAGYHVNQLYSCTLRPWELAVNYLKSLTNAAEEQEFYNSKLGLTHAVEGARVTEEQYQRAIGQHMMGVRGHSRIRTIGVDVGKWLHCVVMEYQVTGNDVNLQSHGRVLKCIKLQHFEEIDLLVRDYQVQYLCVDANPERRKALELCQRFYGRSKMVFYANGINGKALSVHPDDQCSVSCDRTSWLDLTLSRFKGSRITLPQDTPLEFKDQIMSLTRIYKKDADGNPVGQYVCGNDEDHYGHALNYSELALQLLLGGGESQTITEKVL